MKWFILFELVVVVAVIAMALGAYFGRSDMLREFGMTWKDYFERRPK